MREMALDRNEQRYGVRISDLDAATRVACELQSKGAGARLSPLAVAWMAEHKRLDEERTAREARVRKDTVARRSALSKLTPEERAVLGLDED